MGQITESALDATRKSAPSLDVLSRSIARRTTDLISIAIVIGGLLSVTLALWLPAQDPSINAPLPDDDTAMAFAGSPGFPIRQRTVRGDEAAARSAMIGELRGVFRQADRIPSSRSAPAREQVVPAGPQITQPLSSDFESGSDFRDWPVLARDDADQWTIRVSPDTPHVAIGISNRGRNSLISCWGVIRRISTDQWLVWVAKAPETE